MHNNKQKEQLRQIPQVEKILQNPIFTNANKDILKNIITKKINEIKNLILSDNFSIKDDLSKYIIDEINKEYIKITSYTLKPLINATGVVLQTNLGRSIFHNNLFNEIFPLLSHYNNLEYDLDKAKRGERYSHITNMLCGIFNTQSALIVNNNAAAVFLILNTFAKNKEAIISRGELIEIGGSFRIPDIMNNAGVRLVEVGTTNKTRLEDYKNAISEDSRIIMKAHKSNFEILGFTQETSMQDISTLCNYHNIIDYYDLGSGYFKGIICNEPSLVDICKNPPSLLSFSGDKLFGSIQAGIILGRKDLIEQLKQNPLLRALRVDKITILILQATLKRYIENNLDEIPTIKMLSLNKDELHKKAIYLSKHIDKFFNPNIIPLDSLAGGGSLPNQIFESYGISLEIAGMRAVELEKILRKYLLIARIVDNKVALDVRTIQDDEMNIIIDILEKIANGDKGE
ncbi:L-seryl-tRNA(Sec) selenium transferase [Helicobacter sp. 16-1353]|uniref:L-seryl-tRNA(Sec) selenium transferase n=1 Tax=Helicobacter sp. 16-1353 TaxID=2004996 RepID=UPI000DCD1520|nr:L-seryl-tRNA(Sec) selenium transferase [Helicobacter sp. 16-1353]RAX54105.1 L-seryl-tRNA(Sec) selenium transferase [Helicobacter sp. 16-1353]